MIKLIDRGGTVKAGELAPITTDHGHTLYEFKDYFQHPGFDAPAVLFQENGERITLNLKRTAAGFSGGLVSHGIKYGANLSRIRNKPGRYGVTAWYEALQEAAAVK